MFLAFIGLTHFDKTDYYQLRHCYFLKSAAKESTRLFFNQQN